MVNTSTQGSQNISIDPAYAQGETHNLNSSCPNCGYCPHCGRRNNYQPYWDPYYPQPVWCVPWWQYTTTTPIAINTLNDGHEVHVYNGGGIYY